MNQKQLRKRQESAPRRYRNRSLRRIRSDRSRMCGEPQADEQATAQLIADAPLLLEQVKLLTKTLEIIAKEMPYDYWLHPLISDVIGYEKWQAKEMKKND